MKKLRPITILFLGFFITVILGSILLCLPISSATNEWTNYVDSLFVSISAGCVTGLTPFVTADHWSLFGQIVILVLIQIGGLGFMTFISMIMLLFKREFGLYNKSILMQSAGTFYFGSIKKLMKRIIIGTLIFESLGAIILSLVFTKDYGPIGIYYGVFHAISSFCNAGFDVLGNSLVSYQGNYVVIVTISALIFIGGLGFFVWGDLLENKHHFSKYQLHTKIVLVANVLLILVSAALFFVFDFTNLGNEGMFSDMNVGEKILNSFFLAISPRTAGFNAVDLSQLSPAGKCLTIVLMFIGGNSGSTAGGLKVTTIIVIFANLFSRAREKKELSLFKQSIPNDIVTQSSALMNSYLVLGVISTIILTSIEPHSFEECLFEVVSALGTVGLTLGITSTLTIASKIVLLCLMFIGRLGAFALFDFLLGESNKNSIQHPEGRIMVG